MINFGEAQHYLDMKIERNADRAMLRLIQKAYLQQVLNRFDINSRGKTASTFM